MVSDSQGPFPIRLIGWYVANALAIGWYVVASGWGGSWGSTVVFAVVLVGFWHIASIVLPDATSLLPPRRSSPWRWHRLSAGLLALLAAGVFLTLANGRELAARVGIALAVMGIVLVVLPRYHRWVLRSAVSAR